MMRALLFFVVLCPTISLSTIALSTIALAEPPEPTKVVSVEGVTEYQLANGARVLLFPDASRPTITVNMTVLVGSRHEGYGEAGMAHLLEHMVFKGTPSFPDIPRALRDHGASFNGTTNPDRTNYYETMPATEENLEFAIHLESDRLVNSHVRYSDLVSEFTVVRNEFERGENSPTNVLAQRVMAAAYEWHNYGKSTIGNRSDIERVPIDKLQAFYRKYYQPDNVVMIITGRFEEEKALELVNKYLGSIAKPERKLDQTFTEEPPQDGERLVTLRRVGDIGAVMAAFHMPAAAHEDWAPLSILGSVLSEDKVGRLEEVLVETKLATSAQAGADSSHDPGLFFLSVQPTEGNLEKAREVLLTTMDQLAETTFDEEAVERAKKRAARASERTMFDASRMAQALSRASSLGDWRLLFLQRDRVAAVTADEVNRVARIYFPPHNRTVGVFLPADNPQRMVVPSVPSIHDVVKDYQGGEKIAAGEVFEPTPENIDARTTTASIDAVQVALLPKKTRGETVNLTITLRYGNDESLQDRTTAAGLLGSILMTGTKTMDRQALQAKMADLGIRIFAGGGRYHGGASRSSGALSFSVQAKRESLNEAIALLGEILREPAFPPEEFDRLKTSAIDGLKQYRSEPQMLAMTQLSRALSTYPKTDVRYVPTLEENLEQYESMSLEQIIDLYQQQISASSGQIAIVGDFDPDSAMAALTAALKDWRSEVEIRPIDRQARSEMDPAKENISTPDKANAFFVSGLAFPLEDTDKDAEALRLGNFILGGGSLSSRLGDRIRQKEGLSYGVNSSMTIPSRGDDARFLIVAITNPENIDALEKAAMEELTRFVKEGPTESEVADAQTAWLESQTVSRASDSSVASQLAANLYLDRTFAFTSAQEKRIAALTAADIQAAFQKYVDPQKLVIIRAGDFEKSAD